MGQTPFRHEVWTDAGLERLKAIGYNEVAINYDDDEEKLVEYVTVPGEIEMEGTAERGAELGERIRMAKRHGLRTLFLFGSPDPNHNPYGNGIRQKRALSRSDDVTFDSWYDVLNPNVRNHELALLKEFRRRFPEVDDIQVYTFDVGADQTPEFQYGRFSYGIPLSDRLPGYLAALHRVWTAGRDGKVRLWWEPWELSAGQVYTILPMLPRSDFGLMIHSNIAETQLALPVDVWFTNVARISRELGLPVIAQGFFTPTSEEIDPLAFPVPRLVDEQYLSFMEVPGIVGIRDYMYGVDQIIRDLDSDMLQARLRNPSSSTDELLHKITERFGAAQSDVLAYLDLISDAYQVYPWDASWLARKVGQASTDHGWAGATVQGVTWMTPAWQSTRHAKFMKTDTAQPHFWMIEDVQLRCAITAELLDKAIALGEHLLSALQAPDDRVQFTQIQNDVDIFRHVSRSYALHLRETNVAQMLRQDLADGRLMTPALLRELGQLLEIDVANQGNQGRAVEMRRLYQQDPQGFVRRYLIPTEVTHYEKGHHTLTTR